MSSFVYHGTSKCCICNLPCNDEIVVSSTRCDSNGKPRYSHLHCINDLKKSFARVGDANKTYSAYTFRVEIPAYKVNDKIIIHFCGQRNNNWVARLREYDNMVVFTSKTFNNFKNFKFFKKLEELVKDCTIHYMTFSYSDTKTFDSLFHQGVYNWTLRDEAGRFLPKVKRTSSGLLRLIDEKTETKKGYTNYPIG